MVGEGESKMVYHKCVADIVCNAVQLFNNDDQHVTQAAETIKTMVLTADFGKGSHSTIDIAADVACSVIICFVFGLKHAG